ncbi:hypothetical protein GDO78_015809 [Eleutherodactylus coqui]|uniref:Uncharacterized protein n=1 Tax=Eleutherodactylus coqui TaxID=57060 RepID=A0A8J6EDB5_ELECQ|nr:hypothetical protein GDO78_015809 [Eleutherodactylus coqui]
MAALKGYSVMPRSPSCKPHPKVLRSQTLPSLLVFGFLLAAAALLLIRWDSQLRARRFPADSCRPERLCFSDGTVRSLAAGPPMTATSALRASASPLAESDSWRRVLQ